jgi:hypothetical protein
MQGCRNLTDYVALAYTTVKALSPLVTKGAEVLAPVVLKDAYSAIKERLCGDPSGKVAIERFEQNAMEGAPVLQAELARLLAADTDLARAVAEALEKSGVVKSGSLVGKIEANKVVVAHKIDTVNM